MGQLCLYAVGCCANKYGMLVHALALISTHKHDVVTDVLGQRPRFLAELHRLVAVGTKALQKWEGAVWDERETSVVELETPAAISSYFPYDGKVVINGHEYAKRQLERRGIAYNACARRGCWRAGR